MRNRDILLGALIFIVAFLLRVPWFWYPDGTVLDEGIYATYISNIVYDRPYFELHPPLPNIIMASVARNFSFDYKIVRGTDTPFDAFPYAPLRLVNVILGSLLAVLVYISARMSWGERSFAIIAGFGIAFDSALIVYSRTLLPDTMLITFGAAGIVAYLWYEQKGGVMRLMLASIFFGAALSTKWIGLAFVGTAILASLWRKKYKDIVVLSGGVMAVYITVFFIFFGQFSGGFLADRFSFDAVPALAYPKPWDIRETISFLPRYTGLMYRANYTIADHPQASRPWQWPLGQGVIGMWDRGERAIALSPNLAGWGIVFVSVVFAGVMLVHGRLPAHALFALVGYMLSFAPFFVIGRQFFMYHYFMALVFGWLLVPWVVGELRGILAPHATHKSVLGAASASLLVGFFLVVRYTYGI
ncbi:MAG: phospholipid carrier-dependent glycosyltransferase [Candidatus Ryanbacteria bacterium]|nr:phospholipid carrier-dependent glycosyltransferase [Candidatus Ryanbacteria bacterium]